MLKIVINVIQWRILKHCSNNMQDLHVENCDQCYSMEDFKTQARKHCYDTQDLQIAINAMQNLFCLFSVYKKHAFVLAVYNMMVKYALKLRFIKAALLEGSMFLRVS